MNFDGFNVLDFPQPHPDGSGFVYVLFWLRNDGSDVPFYVDQTGRILGRLDDYYWAMFSACTDFRVGEAVRRLFAKGQRVVAKYKPVTNRRTEEARIIDALRAEGFALLNDEPACDWRTADEPAERQRVQKFIDKLLATPGTSA